MTHFSHSRVFQNQTLDEVEDRATVVRPLVDGKQSFDIAVSVWAASADIDDDESGIDVSETPLFSEIVFQGLRLADKHKSVNITYRLPVSIFQRLILKENDLRASFVLIPRVPSLVNQISNFSTWRPQILTIPPVRSWPFPLGSTDNGPQSIADRALDSLGISIPLLEFHEFGSKCTESEPILDTNSADEDALSDGNNDDDEDEEHEEVEKDTTGGPPSVSDILKYPEHALKRHPYVMTRTQIRVVDETHIFNRKLYNREHNKLRSTSCGQGKDKQPELSLCRRTYKMNGNWETRLQLQVLDKETGEPGSTEWAYAPYIGHATAVAGPKDIVPVPVSRENCTRSENTSSTDPEFINIHWRLSYSGRSPAKYVGFDLISGPPERVSYNESEYKQVMAHSKAEMQNGLIGHRFHEDTHPRRRFIVGLLLGILSPLPNFLSLGYWYTRTSTVSISVPGTTFIAIYGVLLGLMDAANAVETQKLRFSVAEWGRWSVLIVENVAFGFSIASFMLATVWRVVFSYNSSRWLPSVHRAHSTHMERASQRLDSRTSWPIRIGMCATLITVNYVFIKYYLFAPLNYHILAPHHPPPGPTDIPTVSNSFVHAYVLFGFPLLLFMGQLSQLLLNQRSKTFAGRCWVY
ncbi:hypothetical protein C8R45DRAFT_1095087 [Mycena sanguinolenta]|nr:hypothetical protein C8R45DRAFT_1095087 [Mycena sanguinolenta]